MFKPTQPQQTIIDAIMEKPLQQNFLIQGVAGAGKTALIGLLSERFSTLGVNSVALTFSKSLADDMQERIKSSVVSTTHSFLHNVLYNYTKLRNIKLQVSKRKDGGFSYSLVHENLVQSVVKNYLKTSYGIITKDIPPEQSKEFYNVMYEIVNLAEKIRQQALHVDNVITIHELFDSRFGVETVTDTINVINILTERFLLRGQTDFTGLLYLPLVVPELKERIPSPALLFVDEINDTNPLQLFIYQTVAKNSNVILVGDNQQCIHIWAGAMPNGMERMETVFSAQRLEYNFSFRIPKKLSLYLNQSCIDTRIKTYESNKIGEIVENLSYNALLSRVQPGEAILCRFNRGRKVKHTLESVSLELLQMGKKVCLLGSTYIEDIKELLSLVDIIPSDWKKVLSAVKNTVENLIAEEITAKNLKEENWRCKDLREKLRIFELYYTYYTRFTFAPHTIKGFIHKLETMYSEPEKSVVLCSVHRSKGKEWKTVYILHLESMVNDVQDENLDYNIRLESHNLILVALTRTLDRLFIVESALPSFLPLPQKTSK